MKKLLSLLLVFCMLASMMAILPTNAAEQEETPDFNDGTWTAISSVEDFIAMDTKGNYYLTNNIDFEGATPTKGRFAADYFEGVLDGCGYSLLNVRIETADDSGIFGISFKGTLKNLTIGSAEKPAVVRVSATGKAVGLVAKTIENGASAFTNVTVYGDVQTTNESGTTSKAAMFAGYVASSATTTFTNCHVYGVVTGAPAAGFLASNRNNRPTVTFTDCTSNATITNNGKDAGSKCKPVAGFYACGWDFEGDATPIKLTFTNCVNNSSVTAIPDNTDRNSAAGFVSLNTPFNFDISFTNCVNNGTITTTGGQAAGLFSMRNDGVNKAGSTVTAINCVNNGAINAANTGVASSCAGLIVLPRYDAVNTKVVIKDSINTATVAGGQGSAGGIFTLHSDQNAAGQPLDISIIGCANLGDVSATNWRAGGIVGAGGFNVDTKLVMKNCYNTGTVSNPGQTAAGLIGEVAMPGAINNAWTISNCYNAGSLSGARTPGIARSQHGVDSKLIVNNCAYTGSVGYDGTGATETNVHGGQAAESILAIINTDVDPETGSTFVADTFGINNGYPLLSWQVPESLESDGFSEGSLDYNDADGSYTISTSGVSGYVSARVNGDKSDLRFVLAVDLEALAAYDDLAVTIEFCDVVGVVKTFTVSFESLLFYKNATAAGNTYVAAEGDALFGVVITGVPNDVWNYAVLSVQTAEDSAMHGVVNHTIINP